jgi:putative FmdB family regulatory protein
MPNYEYRCQNCKRRVSLFFTYADYGKTTPACPYCHSTNLQRKIGRIRVARSDESRMENLADPASLSGLDDDPRALGRMMRSMSKEVGEEMPPEFDEVVERLEKGQSPEDIEKELPDLGAGGAEGGLPDGMDGDF